MIQLLHSSDSFARASVCFPSPFSKTRRLTFHLGAIPPLSELQAQLWILHLLNRTPTPLAHEEHYRLLVAKSARVQYGVDHESYAYQLAKDMGAAPSFAEMLGRGWKVALCWALSANVNPKFRMVGPWKWDGAEEVLMGEIWETVGRRRGPWGKFFSLICTAIK